VLWFTLSGVGDLQSKNTLEVPAKFNGNITTDWTDWFSYGLWRMDGNK